MSDPVFRLSQPRTQRGGGGRRGGSGSKRKPSIVLAREELTELLRAARLEPRAHSILTVLYGTACRRSELALMQWSGLDYATRMHTFWRPKVRDWHSVPIFDLPDAALRLWKGPRMQAAGLIWPGRQGKVMAGSTIWRLIRRFGEMAGIPGHKLHPHVMRASRATHLLEDGVDSKDIQDFLGHVDPRSTEHYLKSTTERLKGRIGGLWA